MVQAKSKPASLALTMLVPLIGLTITALLSAVATAQAHMVFAIQESFPPSGIPAPSLEHPLQSQTQARLALCLISKQD